MQEFQPFDHDLLTPTTKATEGHDQNITPEEIIETGLATEEEYKEIARLAFKLFARGKDMAAARELVLADTKYEFGRLATGQIVVIDEVHTPDSSRYFDRETFQGYLRGETSTRPEQLSKEFVREWLAAQGFTGQKDQVPPPMPEAFIQEVSNKYINLYERMIGKRFETYSDGSNVLDRIEANIIDYLLKMGI